MSKCIALLFAAAVSSLASAADAQSFAEGKDYSPVLQTAAANTDPRHIKVEEFFWYGCPHCYALEPALDAWVAKLPKYVEFVRVPNTLGRDSGAWMVHAKIFYAAEAMNILPKIHGPLFEALHQLEQQRQAGLDTDESIADFASKTAGVPKDAVLEQLKSFFVDSETRRAQQHAQEYGVTGTPTLVIDGRWLVPARVKAEDSLKVADFLIEKIRGEKKLMGKAGKAR